MKAEAAAELNADDEDSDDDELPDDADNDEEEEVTLCSVFVFHLLFIFFCFSFPVLPSGEEMGAAPNLPEFRETMLNAPRLKMVCNIPISLFALRIACLFPLFISSVILREG